MPKVLKLSVSMGTLRDEGSVPLPESWDTMSEKEREQWADEALEVHVSNAVDSWWNVEDE